MRRKLFQSGSYPAPGWRKAWLLALAALVLIQTLIRMAAHAPTQRETWVSGALHLAIIAAYLVFAMLLVSRLPLRWRNWPVAATAAVLLMGTAHAVMTLFDIAQYLTQYYAAMKAPVWLAITDPTLFLSLLDSIDVGPAKLALVIAGLLALHLLLYAPIGAEMARLARRATAAPIPLGKGRKLTLLWPAIAYLLLFAALTRLVPDAEWKRELFHQGAPADFEMAPAELLISATEPAPLIGPKSPLPGARPVILIIVDALRRDRLGVYIPSLATTPFLSGLQKQGALKVYPGSYSTCSFSACGIMSVLASRSWDSFGKRPPTLLDALSRYGYRNYAILAGRHTDFGRLTRLYGQVALRDQPAGSTPNDQALLKMLEETSFPDPGHSFLYLHLISAHAGSVVLPRFQNGETRSAAVLAKLNGGREYRRQYDGRVAQMDWVLSRVFATLRSKGMLTNAIVIITADHGERLAESGLIYHGGAPDGAATSIPLIIYDTQRTAYPDHALVTQMDIAPTFLRAVGGEPLPGWRGQPLQEPTHRNAVPIETFGITGAIVALPGGPYRYRCDRESGDERIQRIDGSSIEGIDVTTPAEKAALLPRLRAARRAIAGPVAGPCDH